MALLVLGAMAVLQSAAVRLGGDFVLCIGSDRRKMVRLDAGGEEGSSSRAAKLPPVALGGGFEDKDATRRTQLANERTFLAWWRSGITALGVSLAVGRIVPELGNQTGWPYAVVGAFYAALGLAMVLYGSFRQRQVEDGIERGEFVTMHRQLLAAFTVLAVGIGVGTLGLIVIEA